MTAESSLKNITVDDLLRQQEGPLRKKRRLSESEASNSEDEGSESGSSSGHHTRSYSKDDNEGQFLKSEDEDGEPSQNKTSLSELNVDDRLGSFERVKSPKRQISTSTSSKSSFASLGISPQLQGALKSMSIKAPTEVQSACIPPLLAGKYVYSASRYTQLNVY